MKNFLQTKRASGFTIIEVMIVLAIAGLIMVIVFIAVPQLQRNQRDNARQNVANRVGAELETYAGNNQGNYPFAATTGAGHTLTTFQTNYFNNIDRRNPRTGNNYTLGYAAGDTTNPTADQILVYRGGNCDGENAVNTSNSPDARSYAVRVQLDRTTTYYCVDNS